MFYTPRFSYGVPETTVLRCAPCTSSVASAVYSGSRRVYGHGYTGGLGRGIPTRHPPRTSFLLSGAYPSEAGPGSPIGAGVGGDMHSAPGRPAPTLRARSAWPARPPWCLLEQTPPPGHRGRDLTSFLENLVKTTKCRQKVSKRPLIVPVSKTSSESRLLKFSDFHF